MSNSSSRRVVITGLGMVSPLGNSAESVWDALSTGRSGVGDLQRLPTEHFPTTFGGEATEFTGDIGDFGELEKEQKRAIRKGVKVMCREIEMGVAVAQLALQNAGLKPGGYEPDRTGVVYGSDYIMTTPDEFIDGVKNCLDEKGEFEFDRWAEEGLPKVTPLWLLKFLPNMPASHIAIYNDLRGPNNSITLREASANLAVAEAFCTISRGSADTIIAGATGTRVHPMRSVHAALQEQLANGSDPARAMRPFDLNRTGMVIGEGAGAIVLENLETAQSRGAKIFGEIIGYGSSTVMDRHAVGFCDKAIANVLRQALRSSNLSPDDIGHIHAHGLSTLRSDADEAKGIDQVFGQRSTPVPIVAAKSYFGQLGAGSGLVELITSVLALENNQLFPVLNFETPDPECPVSPVRSNDVPAGDNFINVNVSPQGQASSVAVRRFEA